MAGKEGPAAAGLMLALAQAAGLLLEREMRVLVEAPASTDGAGVEKVAKQVKAVADAARSVVALEAACLKASDASPPPPSPTVDDSEEMDMDEHPRVTCAPEEIAQIRDLVEHKVNELMGSGEQKCADPGLRARGLAGHGGSLGDGAPARADAA